jgi:tryptophan synthase beta chain
MNAAAMTDAAGRYGAFGGRFVPETLVTALEQLTRSAVDALADRSFAAALSHELAQWAGRPTPLCPAPSLSRAWGAEIWLKREDLAHTGAHKINNALGQAMLARRLGARRVVAETGAGQHGVATAAACARLGIACRIYMGAKDVARQASNAERIVRFGAELVPVAAGDATLRAAIDEALRDWVSDPDGTYYLIGSVVGPHPYPWLVGTLQAVIGTEARAQLQALRGRLPDAVAACVGGGSNAIGLFRAFVPDERVELYGFEAGGRGSGAGEHAATVAHGTPGVLHGAYSLLLHDRDGQIQDTHSVAAGLDYPGIGPEHAFLAGSGRVRYETVSDAQALEAFHLCCRLEGILPALESAHALAGASRIAPAHPSALILVGLSGRGDKDLATLRPEEP